MSEDDEIESFMRAVDALNVPTVSLMREGAPPELIRTFGSQSVLVREHGLCEVCGRADVAFYVCELWRCIRCGKAWRVTKTGVVLMLAAKNPMPGG